MKIYSGQKKGEEYLKLGGGDSKRKRKVNRNKIKTKATKKEKKKLASRRSFTSLRHLVTVAQGPVLADIGTGAAAATALATAPSPLEFGAV